MVERSSPGGDIQVAHLRGAVQSGLAPDVQGEGPAAEHLRSGAGLAVQVGFAGGVPFHPQLPPAGRDVSPEIMNTLPFAGSGPERL